MRYAILAALALSACAGASGGPAQPGAVQIASAAVSINAAGLDPMSYRDAGFLVVNQTCDQYLVDQSLRGNLFGTAQTGASLGGTAAAALLIGAGNPIGAATAGMAAGLASSFLGLLQNAPTMPYSAATSEKVREAVAAIEDGASAPQNVFQAALEVEDAWWPCSLPGAAWIGQQAISTAAISATGNAQMTTMGLLAPAPSAGFHRSRVLVNGR